MSKYSQIKQNSLVTYYKKTRTVLDETQKQLDKKEQKQQS